MWAEKSIQNSTLNLSFDALSKSHDPSDDISDNRKKLGAKKLNLPNINQL